MGNIEGIISLVVALDGSKEAEAILPYIESIARAFDSRVTFVCALVPVEETFAGRIALSEGAMAPGMLQGMYELHDALGKGDASYLATMTKRWAARGLNVRCEEPEMPAAEAILQVARETDADLIAMVTHERNEIGRAVLGSVAEEVVATAPCPVLLVRPE
jgi:nucleotide-binding universal stress UspA family protein